MNTDWDNEVVRTKRNNNMAKKNTTKQKNALRWEKEKLLKFAAAGQASLGDNDSNMSGFTIGNSVSFEDQHGMFYTPYEEVVHPAHYNGLPNGVECWDVTEHFPGNIAMGIKHLWRAGLKPGNEAAKDLDKALQYIQRQKDLVTGKVNKM